MMAQLKKITFLLGIVFCVFHCWTAMFGAATGIMQKAVHLGLILVIFFLDCFFKDNRKWYARISDIFFALCSLGATLYLISIDKTIDLRSGVI